jgi:murein L,D-transpeptidase YcbB/YkuD
MISRLGTSRKNVLSRALALSLVLSASLPVMFAQNVKAEQSDEARQALLAKRSKGPTETKKVYIGASSPLAQGKATTQTEVVAGQNQEPMLGVGSAAALQAAEAHYQQIVSNGGWQDVPKGTYKKGGSNKGIAALNQRLFVEGYIRQEATQGEFAAVYTTATQDAVSRFQRNHGLAVTGIVDGATLKELNVPAERRLAAIRANIPRITTYAEGLGDRYIVVNVPAQQIEAVSNGKVYSRHNAIVGRPERPTPVVMAALSNVAFNPYWNAPPSIIERDIVPKMLAGDSDVLRKMNIHVFQGVGGPEIDPDTVDWRTAVVDDYHFRQEPGAESAMATAKINFPSPFGIYLHDTPERQLFGAGGRFFSSGCVRVDKIAVLINWILNGQDGFNPDKIAGMAESLERLDVNIINPPQLRVAYLTAWPAADNTVAFRPDVYELDGTGFITGQPMPVGEKSADGLRYVLKPIPRQTAAVDAAEAEGFSWFGHRTPKKPTVINQTTLGKPSSTTATTTTQGPVTIKVATVKPGQPKAVAKSKSVGLFDWASYKAEKAKKPVAAKKKSKATPATTDVAKKTAVKPDPKVATAAAKPPVKDATAKVVTTDTKTKAVAAKPVTPAAKSAATAAKKPVPPCKPDATGACKPPAAVKAKPETTATAN